MRPRGGSTVGLDHFDGVLKHVDAVVAAFLEVALNLVESAQDLAVIVGEFAATHFYKSVTVVFDLDQRGRQLACHGVVVATP